MKANLCRSKFLAIVLLSLITVGCLGGQSPPTSFFMISPLGAPPQGASPRAAQTLTHVGLETVVVPEYLNRSEIVLNLDDTVYHLAEFSQWTEPLSDNLTRVLEDNLTKLLQAAAIEVFRASQSSIPLDYRLEIDVLRLDGNLGGSVTLVAQWALLEAEEDELQLMRRSEYREQAADDTYRGLVLAKSRAVEKWSREMADTVKTALGR